METGQLIDNVRVTKNGLGSDLDRMFQSLDSAFHHTTNPLNPFGKSVEFDILLLGPLPGINAHVSMIISKFWYHENEKGSLNFGHLRKRSLSFSFTILRSPVTTWPHGAYTTETLSQGRYKVGLGDSGKDY